MKNTFSVIIFCLLLGLMFLQIGCKDDNNPTEPVNITNSFVGTWKLVEWNYAPYSSIILWTFTDSTVSITDGSSSFNGTYTFNPNAAPATIDLNITGTTPNPNLAIYKFVGSDTLVIKMMTGASGRATNFDAEQNYQVQGFRKQ